MKLSVELAKWRIDRPDEWKMDEFIRNAEKIESERDNALAQNAELVAHIDAIKDAWMAAGSWPDTGKEKRVIANAINAAPAQHLRDHDAEAGRAGFLACSQWINYEDDGRHTVTEASDEYAEKVRRGEV